MVMRLSCLLLAALALVVAVPMAADAQPSPPRRVELGVGAGTVATWWTDAVNGGDVRVTLPLAARGDLEFLGAFGRTHTGSEDAVAFYGAQFRLHFREPNPHLFQPFMTFGAVGVIAHSSRYGIRASPPLVEAVGVGVERRLLPHLSVRAEAQGLAVVVIPVALRLSAGVSIPVGSPKR
jgi:hypothetical protein